MLDGLIVVNKEKNTTSFGIVQKLQKILNQKKIGHIGTLDPNATGVLVCLLGKSCKYNENLSHLDKIYEAELIFGFSTNTLDVTGNVLKKTKFNKTNLKFLLNNIDNVLKMFIGNIKQVPPMVSAKKKNGKKLYELARKNIIVDRKPCGITIYDIKLIDKLKVKSINNIPSIVCKIRVHCSSGTYIRSLCDDIGKKLKINSCMGNLKRISIGNFNINNSYKINDIQKLYKNNNFKFIRPCYYQNKNTALSIGKFEAMHVGHVKILNELKNQSNSFNLSPLIFTFYNDGSISTNEEQYSRLSNMGFKNIITENLDKNFKNMSATYFFDEIIINQLHAKCIVCGDDFSFGKDRKGNIDFLIKNCKLNDIELKIINKLSLNTRTKLIGEFKNTDKDNIIVSSSNIKKYINNGSFDVVNKMLGRNYSINFEIMFTAKDIVCLYTNKLLPQKGIYDIYYYINNECFENKLYIDNDKIYIEAIINNTTYIKSSKSIKIYFK